MEIIVFLLIWVFASVGVGMIAANRGNSGLRMFLISMLLSPLVGIFIALFANPSTQVESNDEFVPESGQKSPGQNPLIADTAVLTPEEAEAMRLRAVEEIRSAKIIGNTASQLADTNVFSAEEMEELRKAAAKDK